MRAALNNALKSAMKDKEALAVSTLRLIQAAVKDRDIAARIGISGSVQHRDFCSLPPSAGQNGGDGRIPQARADSG